MLNYQRVYMPLNAIKCHKYPMNNIVDLTHIVAGQCVYSNSWIHPKTPSKSQKHQPKGVVLEFIHIWWDYIYRKFTGFQQNHIGKNCLNLYLKLRYRNSVWVQADLVDQTHSPMGRRTPQRTHGSMRSKHGMNVLSGHPSHHGNPAL